MTENKKFKRLVRARAARTGESYSTSLQHLRARMTEEPTVTDIETPESETEVEVFACSFCGKSQEQVRKLIAGPGTYICDECVGLCAEIISDDAEADFKPSDEQMAAALTAMLRTRAKAAEAEEARLAKVVRQARAKGLDWSQIGGALGMSDEEAESRFSSEQ